MLAERLIHPRWVNVRRRVRKGLEEAYSTGLDDAAKAAEARGMEIGERIRALGVEGAQPLLSFEKRPPPNGPQALQ
jgi:hypothetical protein